MCIFKIGLQVIYWRHLYLISKKISTYEMKISFLICILLVFILSSDALPNFVILLADDLGYGDVGCFGNTTIRTPNIDKLGENGLKLNHHLAAAAVCTPSRAALLTGRYPIRSGMESSNRNKVFFFTAASGGLPQNETTIARALKAKNYATAIVGKWHLGNDCKQRGDACHHPLNHGFDSFFGLPLSNFKDLGYEGESVTITYMPNLFSYLTAISILGFTISVFTFRKQKCLSTFVLLFLVIIPISVIIFIKNLNVINGTLMEGKEVIEQPIRLKGLTQRIVQKVESFLLNQAAATVPFFLFIPFVHVHTALFCSDEFVGKSKHGRYGDNVEEMDWAVGKIVENLEKLQLLNNTFIYFSSDNGGHIEEVGIDGQQEGGFNGIFRGGKAMGGMEGGIRVPSIISWPGSTLKGELNHPTSQMDLFPTIFELAQIPLPKDRIIDGKSLVPILKGESKNPPHQILFHYCGKEIHAATYIQQEGQKVWKIHWTTPNFIPGTSRCEYVCHCFGDFVVHHNPPLLYDMIRDPSESQSINIKSSPRYSEIISEVEKVKADHLSRVEEVPDQFSFGNTVWKPWLQPCCNFPLCKCTDPNFTS